MRMKKIIIITGASSGMGLEFARQLSNSADELWLIARRKERLDTICNDLSKNGCKALPIALDIACDKGINEFEKRLKTENDFIISMLINNAGFGTYGPFTETPLQKESAMIFLNCNTLISLCSICIPFMTKGSIIINVASLAAFLPLGNFAVYAATKSFVLSFSTALKAEIKHKGISVTSLCPGPVSTEFSNVASSGQRKNVLHGKDAKEVVAHCLKCAYKKKAFAIMTIKWKFAAFASRFVGKYFGAWYTYTFCKRPYSYD